LVLGGSHLLIFDQEHLEAWPYPIFGFGRISRFTGRTGQTGVGAGQTGRDTGQTGSIRTSRFEIILPLAELGFCLAILFETYSTFGSICSTELADVSSTVDFFYPLCQI